MSSDMHRAAAPSTTFATLDEMNKDIGAALLYNRTKLGQIVFLRELYLRIKSGQFGQVTGSQGLPWINATHPGAVSTDQPKQAEEAYGTLGKIGVVAVRPLMKDPVAQGCRSALFAATSPDVVSEQIQNSYIVPDRKVTEASSQAQNTVLGLNLWRLNKEVLELKLGQLPYPLETDELIERDSSTTQKVMGTAPEMRS